MKKALLFGCLLTMGMTMNAQSESAGKQITTNGSSLSFIYGAFCCDGKGYLTTQDDNNIYIYDGDLQLVKTMPYHKYITTYVSQKLNTSTNEWETVDDGYYDFYPDYDIDIMEELYTEDLDAGMFDNEYGVIATQSLFNTDEKFEFIVYDMEAAEWIYSESDTDDDEVIDRRVIAKGYRKKGIKVINEDNETLLTLPSVTSGGIYRFGGNTYFVTYDDDDDEEYSEKEIYTFYKIDPKTSSVRKVTSLPTAVAARFSLNGQQLSKARRGINIIRNGDGTTTKLLVK